MTAQTQAYSPVQSPEPRSRLPLIIVVVAVGIVAALVTVFAVLLANSDSQVGTLKAELSTQSQEISRLTSQENALQQTRQNANTASLGICLSTSTYYDSIDSLTLVTGVSITAPTLTNNAVSCSEGYFVPVVPQSNTAGG